MPTTKGTGGLPPWTRLLRKSGSPRMKSDALKVFPTLSLEFSDFSTMNCEPPRYRKVQAANKNY